MQLVTYFEALDISFCDPLKTEDLAKYCSVLCLVPTGCTRSSNNPAVLQLGSFGSKAESLTSHTNSCAQPHSARSSLVLAFLLFLPPKFYYCISE